MPIHTVLPFTIATKFHHDSRLENASQTLVHTGFPSWDTYMSEGMVGDDPVFLAIYFGIFVEQILDEPDKPAGYPATHPEMLTLAAALGHSEVVNLLLLRGANINANDGVALKGAVKQGRHDMIALLLEHGAKVEPEDVDIVEVTAKAGRKDLVKALIKGGVDINGTNGELIDMAFNLKWDEDIILLLLQHCTYITVRGTEYLDDAAALGHSTVVQYLLQKEVDVNGISNHGSCLCAAVLGRNLDVINMLIMAGADVNYPSPLGCPLKLANDAQSRWDEGHEIAGTLKQHGAMEVEF